MLAPTELILNPDGTLYHIHLGPEDIADHVIIVGDPGRVSEVSSHFTRIEKKIQNREFVTHIGYFGNKRITVSSTGIGTDNIDIFLNELDAAVNIDLVNREPLKEKRQLSIIRIGTCGALQEEIAVDSFVISSHGLGLDALLPYYSIPREWTEGEIISAFVSQSGWKAPFPTPVLVPADDTIFQKHKTGCTEGITATAPGFYGPQGRRLRLSPHFQDLNERLTNFNYKSKNGIFKITNFEMETSALYGLSSLLGHKAITVCAVIANRLRKEYSRDHHRSVAGLINKILEEI
jgi:uridine phosphorylase